jgi:phenylacetate-CoA ligase
MTSTPIPASAITAVRWPALPAGPDAIVFSLLGQFRHSEWWPAETLRAFQFRQLGALCAHARETAPFYRDRLSVLDGVDGDALTADLWRRLPILRRAEIQDAGDALFSRRLPASHGRVKEIYTSGSTGQPLKVRTTAVTALFFRALNLRYHLWHRRDFTATAAGIRTLPDDDSKRKAAEGKPGRWVNGYPSGPMHTFDLARPAAEQLAWLRELNPAYLLTVPSNLAELLRQSADSGVKPRGLRQVCSFSEALDPALRQDCADLWGAAVTDAYSAQEVGMIAIQCPDHPHYHVLSESVFVEVVDDRGDPCPPDRPGRVLVTDLHNFATPLIRYEIGDYAKLGGPCPCGRGLPVLKDVLGKARNLLVTASGDKIRPSFPGKPLVTIAPIRQFQLIQRTVDDIDVNLVMPRPLTAAEEAALRRYFLDNFHHPFTYRFVYVDEIPRTPGGKLETCVSALGG